MEGQMMRTLRILSASVLLAALLALSFETPSLAAGSEKKDAQARPQPSSDGERAFRRNCSRCHQAPESFSPSISGTIVRHMRVRANLSREDERAILKYLNP
jgi:cytochrome c5